MFKPIWQAIEKEFSGDAAWNETAEVFRRDHLSTAAAFARTADYVAGRLRDLGLADVERIPFKADGRTRLGDWIPSPAWDADEAELTVIEPADLAGRLCRYPDDPICLGMNSSSTPPGGVTADLVDAAVTNPRSLRGKFILPAPADRPRDIRAKYAKYGVAGIVSDWRPGGDNPERRAIEPGATYWENVWHETWDRPRIPVFKIPPETGDRFRAVLKRGQRIVVRALVKARNYRGTIDTVTGVIPGRDRAEEIVCVGHVYEIGANDNASGAGCMLEVARVLQALLKRRAVPQLRRSIRFIFPWECYGSLAYVLSKTARRHTILAGINPDMVGNDPCLCGSAMEVSRSPDCCPSPANAFIDRLFRTLWEDDPMYRWGWSGPAGDDGLVFCDPAVGAGTPTLTMWPDRFYHSNQDTMEKVSRPMLRKNGTLIGTYLAFLASAGAREALWLANETYRWSRERLEARTAELIAQTPGVSQTSEVSNDARDTASPAERLAWLRDRGLDHIRSCARFMPAKQRPRFLKRLAQFETLIKIDFVGAVERVKALAGAEVLGDETPAIPPMKGMEAAPRRLLGGYPSFDALTPQQRRAFTQCATGRKQGDSIGDSVPRPVSPGRAAHGPRKTPAGQGPGGPHRQGHTPSSNPGMLSPDFRRTAIFLCDGRRTIAEINAWLRNEFGSSDLRQLVNTLHLLARFGYVALG